MKNLELSDLENVSGGNVLYTAWKPILCAVIAIGVLALTYPVLNMVFKALEVPNHIDSIQS